METRIGGFGRAGWTWRKLIKKKKTQGSGFKIRDQKKHRSRLKREKFFEKIYVRLSPPGKKAAQ